ncbi:hypothetical protein H9P43_007825 [Blastocladiella emersonii ATCC 22665]|nr:hypothetical protein H9P43_007825 [Blastocladiella emersonii ATCC 22665]
MASTSSPTGLLAHLFHPVDRKRSSTSAASPSPWPALLGTASLLQALFVFTLEATVAFLLIPRLSPSGSGSATTSLAGEPAPPFNVRMRGVPVYAALFACAQLYSVFLSFNATARENSIQLIALVLLNLCTVGYAGFQSVTQLTQLELELLMRPPWSTSAAAGLSRLQIDLVLGIAWAMPVLTAFFAAVTAVLALRLYREFGFAVYKKIGADRAVQDMYRVYLVLVTVVKLDLFFAFTFAVQYLALVMQVDLVDTPVTVAALLGMAGLTWLIPYSIRREHRGLVLLSLLGLAAVAAGLGYRLVYIVEHRRSPAFQGIHRFLTFFAGLSLAMLVVTAGLMVQCMGSFGFGLRGAFEALEAAAKGGDKDSDDV